MLQLSEIFIYPVKSLGGISLASAVVTSRGLQYDRRWMLVDEQNKFLTQREHPQMALLQTSIYKDAILIHQAANVADTILLPLVPSSAETILVNVWDDYCHAQPAADAINKWFSQKLSIECRAVYMPDSSKRKLDSNYETGPDGINSFSDDYPILMIGQASLDDLNSRLQNLVPMNRFRPNLVFTGGLPYQEDSMKEFKVNGIHFYGVKLCGRCMITCTNQETTEREKEPLKTLATYRSIGNKVCFGQNVICGSGGSISVGDIIEVN